MKTLFITVASILLLNITISSQVAINFDGTQPTSHTILDVQSDSKGMMIPRMSTTNRNILAGKLNNSHKGMLVYDNTGNVLFIWDGTKFIDVKAGILSEIHDTDYDTYINVELGTDPDDITLSTGGTVYWTFNNGRLSFNNTGESVFIGEGAGVHDDLSDNKNTFVGNNAGNANNTGYRNSGIGNESMKANTIGYHNTAFGNLSLADNTNADFNTAIGSQSLRKTIEGIKNTGLGTYALFCNTDGDNNLALGYGSGYFSLGSNNTFVGYNAGRGSSLNNISGNIFIGYKAGYSETGSNKLYIQNSDATFPLIYGDFNNNILSFNANVSIGTKTPLGTLHIHDATNSNTTVYITPTSSSEDSSTIFMAEDNDATFGMYWLYDGVGNQMELWGKKNSSSYGPHLLINRNDGRVAIGEKFSLGYRLSVEGKIICEEVRVDLSADWPDYVFTKNYKLMPIKKLNKFIKKNGHLPNIPSSDEVNESGLKIGEMQRLMMEKIEELTLYIVEQQRQIDELKGQITKTNK